ncbi:MAG: hypothetical protein V1664_00310 [Candidatus Uhrbacteria bacterium]
MKKMKYSRRLLMAATIIAGLGIGAVGVGTTMAAQVNPGEGANNLIEAIAEKFDLNLSDVQAVFDEQREQREAKRETRQDERLAQALADGKITQAQADVFAAKLEEIRSFRESLATLDKDARQEAVKAHQAELKQWAEDNGVPMSFLPGHESRGGGAGCRMK